MLKTELLELIANGENSGVEFKRDDIRPEQLAKEVVAMANFQGGRVLLGVEDDGTVSSIQRPDLEEWVMNIFQNKIHPMILPFTKRLNLMMVKRLR
ncbi:ATP-binding protein [Acinetobacter johnsonii]|nr:ATP-binding protein [Acinetobacter johnsonii]